MTQSLQPAWDLIKLRIDDRIKDDQYFENQYGVDAIELTEIWITMMGEEEPDMINSLSGFQIGFELGKLHERYINDLNSLGRGI